MIAAMMSSLEFGTKQNIEIPTSMTQPNTMVVMLWREWNTLSDTIPERTDPIPPMIGDSDIRVPASVRLSPLDSCRKITPQLEIE